MAIRLPGKSKRGYGSSNTRGGFGVKEREATVVSNYNVATYIKEFIVEIPEDMGYLAGGYIQIKIPEGEVKYSEMDITAHPQDHPGEPEKFISDWKKRNNERFSHEK